MSDQHSRHNVTKELLDELDRLYMRYYVQNKEPNLWDARTIWKDLMLKYERIRNATQ